MLILVVDDEAIVLSLARDALEDEGYDVKTFAEPHAALEFLTKQTADLLLTDIRMPGLSGIDLVQQARAIHPELPVIFMTGYANLNSAKDAIKQGASDYIMKPFDLSEIRQAVKQALVQKAESAARTTDIELRKLSDLSNLLFMSGDIDSIVASTIRFAVMHQQAEAGAIIVCRTDEAMLMSVSSISSEAAEKKELPSGSLLKPLEVGLQYGGSSPELVTRLIDHPFWQSIEVSSVQLDSQPSWAQFCEHILVTPVALAERMFGYLMLGYTGDSIKERNADFKFISFTARQLAVTLENLFLLRETQHAYDRLRELQETSLELEKLATRGEMAAEVGHELNNFLGVIAGNLSLIQLHIQKQNYGALDKHCTAVARTIQKMTLFTDNLMSVPSTNTAVECVNFDKLIREVVDYLRPQKRFKDVNLKMEIEHTDILIGANSIQLQQLLYNLLNNSADACIGREKKLITIALGVGNDDTCVLTIKDTGCGFEPDNLQRAFGERFTTKPQGHGFGLVVCSRIISNHQGKLTVESVVGEGTTIKIQFPLLARQSAELTSH